MAEEGDAPAGVSIPAGNRGGFSLEDLNRELRRADRDHAREVVRAVVESAILDRFLEAPRGDLPIGILDRENQARLGAETPLVHPPNTSCTSRRESGRRRDRMDLLATKATDSPSASIGSSPTSSSDPVSSCASGRHGRPSRRSGWVFG